MILGLSDTEKKFKTAMDTAGADMTVVNSWLKLYVKTKKNSSGVACGPVKHSDAWKCRYGTKGTFFLTNRK